MDKDKSRGAMLRFLTPQVVMASVFCGCWMIVSSGLIMLNKWILVEEAFNYPILLASFGAPSPGAASPAAQRTLHPINWLAGLGPVGKKYAVGEERPA